jgi:P-type Ca2+ transporter type 2C
MSDYYQQDSTEILKHLDVDASRGLTEEQAASRLKEFGRNELAGSGIRSPWRILWEQLTALMVLILIAAALVSGLMADYKDAIAIAVIVILNTLLGFYQEYRAEKAMAALRKLALPFVRVRRDAEMKNVESFKLVPGDIVFFEPGNVVAADCRVLESTSLQTQESVLTGESQPVRKIEGAINQVSLPLGDRSNMVYMGTSVTAGRGQAVVTATGMNTELGHIAGLVHAIQREQVPLQRRLGHLGRRLAVIALFLVAAIFTLGMLRGEGFKLMFLTAVSIGVAAIPEGLPAVVTIALTLGAQRMLRRKALIRKLAAVETLGSVTVICSDKTGTLTENRMSVATLNLANQILDVRSYLPSSAAKSSSVEEKRHSGFGLLLAGAALCNDAVQQQDDKQPGLTLVLGDPTETALVTAAAELGLSKSDLERLMPRTREIPFTSERKRMTTMHRLPAGPLPFPIGVAAPHKLSGMAYVAFTKGAPAELLSISETVWVDGHIKPLNKSSREQLSKTIDDLAGKGMRVLGVAFRRMDSQSTSMEDEALERDLTFVGFVGMIDPPRKEVAAAVETCKLAGIRPVMITGDHLLTAKYIADHLGIAAQEQSLSGADLDQLSFDQLKRVAASTNVYARVSPEHKLKIIQALQECGEVVAMTGDGVNDAPALKRANIGVAMGVTGSDVAKETADMVLLDDNFATIVAAVEEGRVIYDNVRKFVKYILATNSGEIWVMLVAPFLGMPLPLLPLQILWMNLVTDGLPALALAMEPAESDIMSRSPFAPQESIFARGLGRHVVWVGVLMASLSIAVGYGYWRADHPNWQTMVFTMLTISQMAHVLAIRSERNSLFRIGFLSNKTLLGAVMLTIILQLSLIYVPVLQRVFGTSALSPLDLGLCILLSCILFAAVEFEKWLLRVRRSRPQ